MKKKKIFNYISIGIWSIIVGLFIYYYCIDFKLNLIPIYQYEAQENYNKVSVIPTDMDEYLKTNSELQKKLESRLKSIDPNEYYFLVVYGGEIKSVSMKKNRKNYLPSIKFKKNASLRTVSYYLIPDTRYIDFLKLTKWYHT